MELSLTSDCYWHILLLCCTVFVCVPRWVTAQRRALASGLLSGDKVELLQELGFESDEDEAEWLRWFLDLARWVFAHGCPTWLYMCSLKAGAGVGRGWSVQGCVQDLGCAADDDEADWLCWFRKGELRGCFSVQAASTVVHSAKGWRIQRWAKDAVACVVQRGRVWIADVEGPVYCGLMRFAGSRSSMAMPAPCPYQQVSVLNMPSKPVKKMGWHE